jgi:hypothetical protein
MLDVGLEPQPPQEDGARAAGKGKQRGALPQSRPSWSLNVLLCIAVEPQTPGSSQGRAVRDLRWPMGGTVITIPQYPYRGQEEASVSVAWYDLSWY